MPRRRPDEHSFRRRRPIAPLALGLACLAIASCKHAESSESTVADVVLPGSPMQRLTNQQYDNTVRDLLSLTGRPSEDFAEDEVQAGYAANVALPVQELQLTQ